MLLQPLFTLLIFSMCLLPECTDRWIIIYLLAYTNVMIKPDVQSSNDCPSLPHTVEYRELHRGHDTALDGTSFFLELLSMSLYFCFTFCFGRASSLNVNRLFYRLVDAHQFD